MRRFPMGFIGLAATAATLAATAAEENMSVDPTWEVTTLSNSLEAVGLDYSGTGFETWNPVDRYIIDLGYFRTDLDDDGRSEGMLYWYSRNPHFDGGDSYVNRYADEEQFLTSDPVLVPVADRKAPYAGTGNLQYLAFDSSNVMYRTILSNRHNSQEGHDPNRGWNEGLVKYVAIGEGSLIFDGLVKFTATDLDEPHGYGEDIADDKVVVWLHAIDEEGYPGDDDYIEGHTNLIITAAFLNTFNEGNFVSNYVITCTNAPGGTPVPVDESTFVRPDEWHRLTVTAYGDISNTPNLSSDDWAGFTVAIDGVLLSTGVAGGLGARSVGEHTTFESLDDRARELADRGCLFPSLYGDVDHANDIVAVGFQGKGSCDDLRFSEGEIPPPDENPDLTDEETAAIVNGVRYATFAEAIAAAEAAGTSAEPAEMKLVRDVVIGATDGTDAGGHGSAYFSRGWIILDLNGHTLQGTLTDDNAWTPYTIMVEGVHLVIENTADARDAESLVLAIAGQSVAWYRWSGELAFDSGYEPPTPSVPKLCMIGAVRYDTFAEAMSAWDPDTDGEIELLEDVAETNRYLVSDYVAVNLSGNTLKVDFELAQPDSQLDIYGGGEFAGEVTANTNEFAYAEGWEFFADAAEGSWSFGERVFPKTLTGAAYSAANPYVIADKWDLKQLASAEGELMAKNYLQVADIDLEGEDWKGIGEPKQTFTGEYDGGGRTIVRLTLAKLEERYNGLFYSLAGTVGNLGISTDGFTTNGEATVYSAGVVAAYVTKTASIRNVRVEGKITAAGSLAAFGGFVKGRLNLERCENYLTQNVNYLGGQNVAFAVALGSGGELVGQGGNRANESLPVDGGGYGRTLGFEKKSVEASIATYDPDESLNAIVVAGEEVPSTNAFETANSQTPIVYVETPTVTTNASGAVTITAIGGQQVGVPDYYSVSQDGQTVTLSLAESVTPQIGVDGSEAESPLEVTESEVTIRISNAREELYYRLVYKDSLADAEWQAASGWVKGDAAGSFAVAREGDARYYAVQVTDVTGE